MASLPLSISPSDIPTLLKEHKLRVAVIGLGRIGLPTAVLFANSGAQVVGADINPRVVSAVEQGKSHLVDEPGIPELIASAVAKRRLRATTDVGYAASDADVIILSVPTPVDSSKVPDYSAVRVACKAIGSSLKRGSVVVIESTVGPGTVEEYIQPILEAESKLKAGRDFGLASCPERSDPGNVVKNMKSVPRIVGATDPGTSRFVSKIYEAAFGVEVVAVSNPRTANAVKLTENLFRDVNIALANEFALLFEKLDIDVIEVINACATKYNFMPHYPGPGVGGPCLIGSEFVFLADGKGLHVWRLGDYVDRLLEEERASVERYGVTEFVVPKEPTSTLSFDGKNTVFNRVRWFSRRNYTGKVRAFQLTSNRDVTVTDDHPMLVKSGDRILAKRARDVQVGDEVPISTSYRPPHLTPTHFDIIEELQSANGLEPTVIKVKPVRTSLREHMNYFSPGLKNVNTPESRRQDFYRYNYLPLGKYLALERWSSPPIDHRGLKLYTSRGPTCQVPAVYDLDEDFWRFMGYYASEGCIVTGRGPRGVRERIKISFGEKETDLIEDCRSILARWGIEPEDEIGDGSHSLRFSSRVFAFFLNDVLLLGKNSYTKRVPPQLFFSPRKHMAAFLQGLFKGDEWVEGAKKGRSVSQGYATASPELFQGVLLLLQAFELTPTCRKYASKKSTVPSDLLRITKYNDLLTLQQDVGGLPKLDSAMVGYYWMTKRSPALVRYGSCGTAFVKDARDSDYSGFVYNMEVENDHTFVSSFGIITHNCLPANPYYLISEAIKVGNIPYLIRMAREVNDRMPEHVIELTLEAMNELGKTLKGSEMAMLGVSYKPNVKDVQLSPAEPIFRRLVEMGARVRIYDPMFKGEEVFGSRSFRTLREAVAGTDCLVIVTAQDEFKRIGAKSLFRMAKKRIAIVDARNVIDPKEAMAMGLVYRGVGRRPSR